MAQDEEKTGKEAGTPSTTARFFLVLMLLFFAGTVALLLYAYFNHAPP